MRALLLTALVASALVSGCLVEETPQAQALDADDAPTHEGQQFSAEPTEAPAPEQVEQAPPHGEPQRTEGPVTTGTEPNQVPGAWAKRTITITNDAYGAALVQTALKVPSGDVAVEPVDGDHYELVAVLEARAATEAQAREELARAELNHTDALDGDVLRLAAAVEVRRQADPAPGVPQLVRLDGGANVRAQLVLRVPVALPHDLRVDTASADIGVRGLRGPAFALHSASGDVLAKDLNAEAIEAETASGDVRVDGTRTGVLELDTASGDVRAGDLTAGTVRVRTASGDVRLDGAVDDLDAGTSSGDLVLDLAPQASGAYQVQTASGDAKLSLPAEGRGYRVVATTASGDLDVDLADGEATKQEERRVEAATAGFDAFAVRTVVEASTSSGDVTVTSS